MLMQTQPPMFLENPYRLLMPGQWIRSHNGLVWHHGIITGFGWDFATNTPTTMVTHNRPIYGVTETTLEQFSTRYIEIYREPTSAQHGQWTVRIAKANWGRPYAVFNQNCEHFASFCYTGSIAESKQVRAFLMASLGVGLTTALVMNSARS